MRLFSSVSIVSVLMLSQAASASSIMTVPSGGDVPSIVRMGAPEKVATAIDTATTSSAVAAKPAEKSSSKARRNEPVMVIRGGIVGDAFAGSGAAAEVTLPVSGPSTASAAKEAKPAAPQPRAPSAPPPPSGPTTQIE